MNNEVKDKENENRNKKTRMIIKIVIVVFLVGLNFTLILLLRFCSSLKHEKVNNDKFITAIQKNSNLELDNAIYTLTEDITIDVNNLPNNITFYGTLDGDGHTIEIQNSENSLSRHKPLFQKISKGAVVKNLNIVRDVLSTDIPNQNIAGLAYINNGTIEHCSISIGTIEFPISGNASSLVNYNYGEIKSVYSKIDEVKAMGNKENWDCYFGAIASYNDVESTVSECCVQIDFDKNDLPVFEKDFENHYVGYIFGGNTKAKSYQNLYLYYNEKMDIGSIQSTCIKTCDGPKFNILLIDSLKKADFLCLADDWDISTEPPKAKGKCK